ncbi:MAG TPA: HEAT repeat domain-containing protein [Candidatus Gastranaerophilaceae bacterium]|nr:HEAT repeat domain-containing protein [Candidatus Gastranaerophilaceae bacterium]HPT41376.1 HEAT repeat domain-containing protein [Candidatus Gastranaerophilaceae bacterium]
MQNTVVNPQTVAPAQAVVTPAAGNQPQVATQPVVNPGVVATQNPQTVQVPNYSGVNIQIYNPSVMTPGTNMAYPSNYYTTNYGPQGQPQQAAAPAAPAEGDKKKTEKRDIVELTDDYIKNLENYLNSQDPEVRMMGAKEVLARLQEDDSRKDDKALNALVNKMLQDPSQKVRVIALAALDSKAVTGDDLTVQILKNMQNKKTSDGQDAMQASQILLKMSGNTVKKEFEVKDKPKKEEKSDKKE